MKSNVEIKIAIDGTPKEYIDQLILGLVHSGYDVYFTMEKDGICITGWEDEMITKTGDDE